MKYTITIMLPDRQKLGLETIIHYAALTETEIKLLNERGKDIGLESVKTDIPHSAWHIKLTEETTAKVKALLLVKGIPDIPFVLANGEIYFSDILLIDDTKNENIPIIISKLVGIAIAYHLIESNDDELPVYISTRINAVIAGQTTEDIRYPGALLGSGWWEIGYLETEAKIIISNAKEYNKICIEE